MKMMRASGGEGTVVVAPAHAKGTGGSQLSLALASRRRGAYDPESAQPPPTSTLTTAPSCGLPRSYLKVAGRSPTSSSTCSAAVPVAPVAVHWVQVVLLS